MTTVRTRFAPSPTGYLHIGGARTAIFNWLYARRHGGQFILRIEDTDRERSTEESIDQIISAMKWLKIDHDEGPFRQTDRADIYAKNIARLLDEGKAYRCVCSKETLDQKRKEMMKNGRKPKYDGTCRGKNIAADCEEDFVIRFMTPGEGETVVEDILRGEIRFNNDELDDMIIARTDGSPTYNFCVVIDDADMAITHVIRGDDHLANTPRQAVIYNALGFDIPKFAHVSMILGKDKARLSKRHGALSVLDYRDKGILPQALFNYLVRLGWSHGDDEVFTIDELKNLFDLDSVSKSAASFDEEKLLWLNAEHIKMAPTEFLVPLAVKHLADIGVTATPTDVARLLPMFRERAKTLLEMASSMSFFFLDEIVYEEKAVKKFLKPKIAHHLLGLAGRLQPVDFGSEEAVEEAFRDYIESHGLKLKDLAQPVRIALTGGTVSPGLFQVMSAIGREKCLSRIKAAAKKAESGAE
ncbi:Glutamyl-tRNA synthetase [hydrothermal vent metagenome]|uniref:glutamate--tRNA ligase n=1 Tax=hydrothermal vent metagenome TaxID=652676 RepID=A0A3B1CMR0_9ZZZZ